MTRTTYFAHSHELLEPESWHHLSRHLQNTGERAAAFLDAIGAGDLGRTAGLLHDLGKYSEEFQQRLAGKAARVDHSTAGAQAALKRYPGPLGKIVAYCVAGHHAGLANGVNGEKIGALADRLAASPPPLDPIWKTEVALPELQPPTIKPRDASYAGFSASFLIRMVFSALVDADYLDTEAWFSEVDGRSSPRGNWPGLERLLQRLDSYLTELSARAAPSDVNRLRQQVLTRARTVAAQRPGLFTLTVPTGGGKTLSSLAFALEHAVRHGQQRVIYVIPFTSIVEQTAAVFRHALREGPLDPANFVLEHHSAFDEDRIGEREARDKLRLAMENWDAPIVVTTAVQFFESLFANRPSRCRKLHNIANSVVILDEAQTLPLSLLVPCVSAMDELSRNWRSSIVLCTATQPAFQARHGFNGGLVDVREIAPDPKRLYRQLRRTRIRHAGTLDDAQLTERLLGSRHSLCIVNTRRHARELFEAHRPTPGSFHLTTAMCARHRSDVLSDIRERLDGGRPVRLVATSLIEAGVDVDFETVFRAEAGLESIIQAAGRCNREGRSAMGDVYVFEPAPGPGRAPSPELAQFASAARSALRRHEDPQSLAAVTDYFREVYWLKGPELDAHRILAQLNERRASLDFPFETIARQFRLISSDMVPLIVPYAGRSSRDRIVSRLLEELRWVERPGRIARLLQPYVVPVPRRVRERLLAAGAVSVIRADDFAEQFVVLTNPDLYRHDTGLIWHDPEYLSAESLVY